MMERFCVSWVPKIFFSYSWVGYYVIGYCLLLAYRPPPSSLWWNTSSYRWPFCFSWLVFLQRICSKTEMVIWLVRPAWRHWACVEPSGWCSVKGKYFTGSGHSPSRSLRVGQVMLLWRQERSFSIQQLISGKRWENIFSPQWRQSRIHKPVWG